MRKLFALAACISLSSCSAVLPAVIGSAGSLINPADAVGDKVVIKGTRALILAHTAYQAAAQAATTAIEAGWLSDEKVDQIDAINKRALAALNAADGTLSSAQRAAAIFNAANEINRTLGEY